MIIKNIFSIHIFLLVTLFIFLTVSYNNLFSQVKPGIDVLEENYFSDIAGKKVVLFTNSTGRSADGRLTAEILARDVNVNLVSIVTPEHGFFASVPAGEKVTNDRIFGVPIYSLYGDTRKPGSKILAECDIIVADIQDIGVRSYTYISTLFKIMQAAAENKKPIYVLDRPNPLGANNVDGNVLEKGMESFVGIVPISYIHGLTIGELALMINEEGWLAEGQSKISQCDLNVVRMIGYKRNMSWEETGLMWFPTSPNVPTVNSARGLATTGIFGELGIISIGIGTSTPFQLVGTIDFDWYRVRELLNDKYFNGISMSETRYMPQFAMNSGKSVKGVFLNFRKESDFSPYSAGINLFLSIRKIYPNIFDTINIKENSKSMFRKVTGTTELYNAFFNKYDDEIIMKLSQKGLVDYLILRKKYLLYD